MTGISPIEVLGISFILFIVTGFFAIYPLAKGKGTLESLADQYAITQHQKTTRLLKDRSSYLKYTARKDWLGKLATKLWRTGLPLTVITYLGICTVLVVVVFIFGWWWLKNPLSAAVLSIVGIVVPDMYLEGRIGKARTTYLQQFEVVLESIANSIRLGHVPIQAIADTLEDMEGYVKKDFEEILTNVSDGMLLKDAIESIAWRRGIREVETFAVAVGLGEEHGGDLFSEVYNLSKDIGDARISAKKARSEVGSSFWLNIITMGLLVGLYTFMMHTVPEISTAVETTRQGAKATMFVAGAIVVQLFFMRAINRIRSS